MSLTVALINLKPGTGKTTSAVWLAHAFYELGRPVLLVDADPAASALEWSDLADGFPFRIIGMPSKELHRRVPEVAKPGEIVVIDAPQMEDHKGIARSVLRLADELVIPVAPHGIEINRMAPVADEIDDIQPVRATPARVSVLLNRINRSSTTHVETREDLTEDGWHVLTATVPFVNRYSQSFGLPVKARATEFEALAEELLKRGEG
ncbi:ParA family protein [Nonomuraea gerenzanensis]|uniref:Chromosome (Plasmid) partitioning protein ParA n=1 Tax=Nonomuraea gerenzanensis TaxID=93944 RepID=A0A1M4BKS8_9ACTN|nr:ParA family protein [Nonomuraea gerenzanensis]UBU19227.1 ParA family protein [Nonomuraea gerenzanensis]SAP16246.1 Chromosome (plasmid) partitioning protein ParA [Nonomuraea gerenzanensis]